LKRKAEQLSTTERIGKTENSAMKMRGGLADRLGGQSNPAAERKTRRLGRVQIATRYQRNRL